MGFNHIILKQFGHADTGGNKSPHGVIEFYRSGEEYVGWGGAGEEVKRRDNTFA